MKNISGSADEVNLIFDSSLYPGDIDLRPDRTFQYEKLSALIICFLLL